MRRQPLALDKSQILVTTRILADRWSVNPRTVLRVCRVHNLQEIRLQIGGRIFFPREEIEALELQLFAWAE